MAGKIYNSPGIGVTSHTQSASTITTGTFPEQVVANSNTNYTTAQIRNVIISTLDPNNSQGNNGDIWIKYS